MGHDETSIMECNDFLVSNRSYVSAHCFDSSSNGR